MVVTLAASAIAAGIGAFMSSRERKKQRAMLAAQANENRNRYYESLAMSEKNKNWALRKVQEQNDKMNRGINSSAVATGTTHENKLAAMQNAGNIYADAANTAAANQNQQELALKQNYENKDDAIKQQQQQSQIEQGNAWAQLGSNLAGSIADYGAASMAFKNKKMPNSMASQINPLNKINTDKYTREKVKIPVHGLVR
jgi:hypothetical protein